MTINNSIIIIQGDSPPPFSMGAGASESSWEVTRQVLGGHWGHRLAKRLDTAFDTRTHPGDEHFLVLINKFKYSERSSCSLRAPGYATSAYFAYSENGKKCSSLLVAGPFVVVPGRKRSFWPKYAQKTAKPCRKLCCWLIFASFFAPIMIATYGDSQQVLEENFKPKTTSH